MEKMAGIIINWLLGGNLERLIKTVAGGAYNGE